MKDNALMYRNFIDGVKTLPPEQRAEAYEAYFSYVMDDEEYVGSNVVINALMAVMKSQLDKDKANYEDTKQKRRDAANARWSKQVNANESKCIQVDANDAVIDKDIDIVIDIKKEKDSKESKKKFVRPTLEQVADYCKERNNKIDAQHFLDFYDSNGWVQGAGKKPIKDWKACIRLWEQRNKDGPPLKKDVKAGIERKHDLDAWLNAQVVGGLK